MSLSLELSIAFLVADLARAFRQRFEAALAAAGLEVTPGEARTLFHAARHGPTRQNALAESMSIEPMTLVNFLDRLERRGWITRAADPDDRRAKIVQVTAAARPLVEKLDAVAARVRAGAASGLSASEMQALRRGLERMRSNLASARAEEAA